MAPVATGTPYFYQLFGVDTLPEWQGMFSASDNDWLVALQPSRAPLRVSSQQGLFTIGSPIDLDHRAWIAENIDEAKRRAILIPKGQKKSIMRVLASMNITAASLFPDLGGAALSISQVLQSEITTVNPADDWVPTKRSPLRGETTGE